MDPWERYCAVEHQLEGWWHPQICEVLKLINELHGSRGVSGWIVEFGVFRGRSLAALALMAREHEHTLGVDCFELAQYNTSNSGGVGSVEAARQALALVGACQERVTLLSRNLAELNALELEKLLADRPGGYQRIRVAHIDAGHEFKQATQDLETIVPHLDPLGVLLLDDVYHHQWPEVSLAFSRFLWTHAGWDVLGCLHSRVFLVRQEAGPLYRDALRQLLGPPWQTFQGRPYFTVP